MYLDIRVIINENVVAQFKTLESKRNNIIQEEKNLLIFTLDFGLYF